jgi:hypothetical protein
MRLQSKLGSKEVVEGALSFIPGCRVGIIGVWSDESPLTFQVGNKYFGEPIIEFFSKDMPSGFSNYRRERSLAIEQWSFAS